MTEIKLKVQFYEIPNTFVHVAGLIQLEAEKELNIIFQVHSFGASNGGRTGVRGGRSRGGRGSGNRGGRGSSRIDQRSGLSRGTRTDHDDSLPENEQTDATVSQRTLFDLNIDSNMEL